MNFPYIVLRDLLPFAGENDAEGIALYPEAGLPGGRGCRGRDASIESSLPSHKASVTEEKLWNGGKF